VICLQMHTYMIGRPSDYGVNYRCKCE
jgi:hypothetical protein